MKHNQKSQSGSKKHNEAKFLLKDEGGEKENPWNEEKTLKGKEATLKQSTAQAVQSLPPLLANDQILQALLQPRSGGPCKFGELPNVTAFDVSYGGTDAEQPCDSSNSNIVQRKAHKDKVVEYDKTKGFVTTSWANFMMEPEESDGKKSDGKKCDSKKNDGKKNDGKKNDGSKKSFTSHKEGLFIRHVTSTVINPSDLFKDEGGSGSQKGGGKGKERREASVHISSTSFSSNSLLSNSWSNVLMYTPDEQVFKIDVSKETCEEVEGPPKGHKKG